MLKTVCGPTRTTWALQQIVGDLGYSGRDADVVVTAALDPQRKSPRHSIRLAGTMEREARRSPPSLMPANLHCAAPSALSSACAASQSRKVLGQLLSTRRNRRVASSFAPLCNAHSPL